MALIDIVKAAEIIGVSKNRLASLVQKDEIRGSVITNGVDVVSGTIEEEDLIWIEK